jgi:hypothetical protein
MTYESKKRSAQCDDLPLADQKTLLIGKWKIGGA